MIEPVVELPLVPWAIGTLAEKWAPSSRLRAYMRLSRSPELSGSADHTASSLPKLSTEIIGSGNSAWAGSLLIGTSGLKVCPPSELLTREILNLPAMSCSPNATKILPSGPTATRHSSALLEVVSGTVAPKLLPPLELAAKSIFGLPLLPEKPRVQQTKTLFPVGSIAREGKSGRKVDEVTTVTGGLQVV